MSQRHHMKKTRGINFWMTQLLRLILGLTLLAISIYNVL